MERSPIKDIEIKVLLKNALTNEINDRKIYMKRIDASYNIEGYNKLFKKINEADEKRGIYIYKPWNLLII